MSDRTEVSCPDCANTGHIPSRWEHFRIECARCGESFWRLGDKGVPAV